MEELIGTLLTYELILNKSNGDSSKGKKTLVLKANEETKSSKEKDDDDTTLITKHLLN